MKSMFINNKNIAIALLLIFIFIVIYLLNSMTLYTSDDYTYSYVYNTFPSEMSVKIDGIPSIIESQILHYKNWNGRFVSHSLVQFFMQYNKSIFNIFNTLIFIFVGLLIFFILKEISNIKNNMTILFYIYMLIWLQTPEFGSSFLWLSGSINYSWMSIIYLTFIFIALKKINASFIIILGYIVLGFLSGATNENSGPAASLIVFLIILNNFLKYKKIELWKVLGFVSSIIGFLLMIGSPGSQKRGSINLDLNTIYDNIIRTTEMNISLFMYSYILLFFIIITLIYIRKIEKNDIFILTLFLVGHFASIYCMIFSPEFPARAAFGSSIMLIIVIVYCLNKLDTIEYVNYSICIFLYTISVSSYTYAFVDIENTYKEVTQQIDKLRKFNGNDDVTLKMISKPKSERNAYYATANLSENKKSWFNSWMAKYYRVKSITGEK